MLLNWKEKEDEARSFFWFFLKHGAIVHADPSPLVLIVSGLSGMGKTAFASELCSHLSSHAEVFPTFDNCRLCVCLCGCLCFFMCVVRACMLVREPLLRMHTHTHKHTRTHTSPQASERSTEESSF